MRRSRLARCLLVVALAAAAPACGGSHEGEAHPRVAAAPRAPEPRPVLRRRAPLRFDLGGRAFPLPVVKATLAGQPTLFLVDTGANVHVVAGWLARKLGLPMKKLGDVGSDHVGKVITTWRVEAQAAALALEGWGPVTTNGLVVTEIPEAIEKMGIGGILCPQRLADEGDAVLLDLYRGELRSAWWDVAERDLVGRGSALVVADAQRACQEADGGETGLGYVLPATIEGHAVSLLLDTGAYRSDVFVGSGVGQKLLPRSVPDAEPVYAASGRLVTRKLKDARIVTGEFSAVGDVGLVQGAADGACPRDGVLAMDVLRACALLLGRTRMAGVCTRIDGAAR